jgi:hypothetical protein
MDEARRDDDLVDSVAPNGEARAGARDLEGDGPEVNGAKDSLHVPVVEIELDPAELRQLRDLPEDDRRDRRLGAGSAAPFAACRPANEGGQSPAGPQKRGRPVRAGENGASGKCEEDRGWRTRPDSNRRSPA